MEFSNQQQDSDPEFVRLQAIKNSFVQMSNTRGWPMFKQLATNVVNRSVQESLDEEDVAKAESKRLKAKALQKGFHDLFEAVEAAMTFAAAEEEDSGLGSLEVDFAELAAQLR